MFFALLHRGLLSGEVIPAIFLKREQLSMWKAVLKKRAKSLGNRRGYRLRLCLEFRDLNVAIDLDLYSRLQYFIALLRCGLKLGAAMLAFSNYKCTEHFRKAFTITINQINSIWHARFYARLL